MSSANKLQFTDVKGLNQWCKEFYEKVGASDEFTRSPSLCKGIPKDRAWEPSGDSKANNAEIARLVHDRLKVCAPIRECAWTASEFLAKKSFTWFRDNQERPIMQWAKKYGELRIRAPTYEEVKAYQDAALAWRKDIGYGQLPLTEAISDHVVTEYKVTPDTVQDLNSLLRDMVRRRNEALGIDTTKEKKPATHINDLENWIKLGDWAQPCPWGEWGKKNKSGQMLAVTACAGLIQRKIKSLTDLALIFTELGRKAGEAGDKEGFVKEKCDEVSAFFKALPGETETFMKGKDGKSGPFVQQGSALDTAFSSYFWAWRSGITTETLPALSGMLFELGKHPTGKGKLEKKLKQSPYRWAHQLVDSFATFEKEVDSIHMHPGVLTSGRLCTEMVCSFGAFPVSDPPRISEGSSSPRFILNLHTNGSNPAAISICNMFREYRRAYQDWEAEEIVPVEHLLHQTFLNKHGPFINVSQVKGKALDVHITGE